MPQTGASGAGAALCELRGEFEKPRAREGNPLLLRCGEQAENADRGPCLDAGSEKWRRGLSDFIREILPAAQNIPIQIAHMAGAGTYVHDDALQAFADAVARQDRTTRNLYFDLTGAVGSSTPADKVEQLAARIRQIGVERVVFGSDMHPNPDIKTAWATFRQRIPLTDAEVSAIADNEASDMRKR